MSESQRKYKEIVFLFKDKIKALNAFEYKKTKLNVWLPVNNSVM